VFLGFRCDTPDVIVLFVSPFGEERVLIAAVGFLDGVVFLWLGHSTCIFGVWLDTSMIILNC
jgi:hypothetical protein